MFTRPAAPRALTLALGGGGAKCASQAGVLAVLEEAGLPIGPMVGVSGGGVVAILYALGMSPLQIRDAFESIHLVDVWEPDPERQSVFGAKRIRARLLDLVRDKTFADLRRPATAMAMDLNTGQAVALNSGPLVDALMATIAIPGLFPAVRRPPAIYVDCGVVSPLPVREARGLGPRVVAVDVLHHNSSEEFENVLEARGPLRYAAQITRQLGLREILGNVYQMSKIAQQELSAWNLRAYPPDCLLRPAVGSVGLFGFHRVELAYVLGEAAARAALPQLEALARQPDVAGWRRLWQRWRGQPSQSENSDPGTRRINER